MSFPTDAAGGRLMAGTRRFWTLVEAVDCLVRNGAAGEATAATISSELQAAATEGRLTVRTYPTGDVALVKAGKPWYFFAEDFNAWAVASGIGTCALPTTEPPAGPEDTARRKDVLWREMDQPERRRALNALGLENVSAAPIPISPVRSTGSSQPLHGQAPNGDRVPRAGYGYPAARWQIWRHAKRVALWEGVCLSVNIEPSRALLTAARWPAWFDDRISFLERFLADGETFTTIGHGTSFFDSTVLATEFFRLAVTLWPEDAPAEMKALANAEPALVAPTGTDEKLPPPNQGTTVQHSTKAVRSHVLDAVIQRARSECASPDDYMAVFARMERLADDEVPPLLASTDEGIKYSDQGASKLFKRSDLRQRFGREKKKRNGS